MNSSPNPRLLTVIAVAAAVGMGCLVAVQSRINGELGVELGDGFTAALISFSSGLVLLAVAMAFSRRGRAGLGAVLAALRRHRIPWWYVCGGAAGALLVLCQGLTAAALGVALFTVAIVCGQTISAAVIDRVGLGSLRPSPFTWPRVIGTVLAMGAVLFAVSARIQSDVPIWMLLLPLLAGGGIGWQQAVNGQVRQRAGSALTATFINFVVGTTVLALATLVRAALARPELHPPGSWWLYLGGPIGVVFIAGASVIVHRIGLLLLGLATISGQLIASVVLDLVVPVPGHQIVASTVIGTAVTLVATAIAAIPVRGRRIGTPPIADAMD